MPEHDNNETQCIRVDTDLIRMFLEMTPEQRLATNDNAVRAIEELRNGFKKVLVLNLETILELKRDSKDPRDRQRLPIYEETLKLTRDKRRT